MHMDENYKPHSDTNPLDNPPTTKLLKKRPEQTLDQGPVTSPITKRLAEVIEEEKEKKQTGRWLFIGIGAVVLITLAVIGFIFLGSSEMGIFSGGGSDISATGSDSMEADIVQGRAAAAPAEPNRSPAAGTTARQAPSANQTEAAPVNALPSSDNPSPTTAAPPAANRETSRPADPEPPPSAVQNPVSIQGGSDDAPSIGNVPVRPAASAPQPAAPVADSSLEDAFKLDKKESVQEGQLVSLTDPEVIKPEVTKQIQPRVPMLAAQHRRAGLARIRVLIDEKGNVTEAEIQYENPQAYGFGKAALEAARQFKFKPAMKNNVKVKVWHIIPFRFS